MMYGQTKLFRMVSNRHKSLKGLLTYPFAINVKSQPPKTSNTVNHPNNEKYCHYARLGEPLVHEVSNNECQYSLTQSDNSVAILSILAMAVKEVGVRYE